MRKCVCVCVCFTQRKTENGDKVEENVSPTGLRQFRKSRKREESFEFIEKSAERSGRGKRESEREESAQQVRSEDKKETARNKERKRFENLGREKNLPGTGTDTTKKARK